MIYFQRSHLHHSQFCSFTSICKHSCFTCILFKILCFILGARFLISLHKKMKFFIKDFFSKCDRIRCFLRIWSHLLKKPLMETFTFCAVFQLLWIILKINTVKFSLFYLVIHVYFMKLFGCLPVASFKLRFLWNCILSYLIDRLLLCHFWLIKRCVLVWWVVVTNQPQSLLNTLIASKYRWSVVRKLSW